VRLIKTITDRIQSEVDESCFRCHGTTSCKGQTHRCQENWRGHGKWVENPLKRTTG